MDRLLWRDPFTLALAHPLLFLKIRRALFPSDKHRVIDRRLAYLISADLHFSTEMTADLKPEGLLSCLM